MKIIISTISFSRNGKFGSTNQLVYLLFVAIARKLLPDGKTFQQFHFQCKIFGQLFANVDEPKIKFIHRWSASSWPPATAELYRISIFLHRFSSARCSVTMAERARWEMGWVHCNKLNTLRIGAVKYFKSYSMFTKCNESKWIRTRKIA